MPMIARFQRDSMGLLRRIFCVLFILAICVTLSSVLSCRVTMEGDPYGPGGRPPHSRIEGLWFINVNISSPGKMEFYQAGDVWAARIWFDAFQRWEDLTDVSFNPRTGEVWFFRPLYAERFYGTVSGHRIRGTYTYAGSTYPWEARRP